jgi:hypothetical protein
MDEPKYIILSEIDKKQKDKYCMISLIGGIENGQIQRDTKNSGTKD